MLEQERVLRGKSRMQRQNGKCLAHLHAIILTIEAYMTLSHFVVSLLHAGGLGRASASGRGRGSGSGKRSKAPRAAPKPSGTGRGRGRVKGATESAAGRVVKVRKRAASSSPDRGPLRSNRRKTQPPTRLVPLADSSKMLRTHVLQLPCI